MIKLDAGQRKAASEITGNVSVAWFTAGVISPFFVQPKNLSDFIAFLTFGSTMAAFFVAVSLILVRGIKP